MFKVMGFHKIICAEIFKFYILLIIKVNGMLPIDFSGLNCAEKFKFKVTTVSNTLMAFGGFLLAGFQTILNMHKISITFVNNNYLKLQIFLRRFCE